MSFTVKKLISADFGGVTPDPGILHRAIDADVAIATTIDGVNVALPAAIDDVDFIFAGSGPLSGPEVIALDAIVSANVSPTGEGLRLTSNAARDIDGVFTVAADGVAKHTVTATKIDANGVPTGAGTEALQVFSSSGAVIPNAVPSLVAGVTTFDVGPTSSVQDITVIVVELSGAVSGEKIALRYTGTSSAGVSSAIPTKANKAMPALVTALDGDQATATTVAFTPAGNGYITVAANSVSVEVGDGVKTKNCYFSGDGGTTARTIATIVAGDTLHWNGSVIGYELDTNDIFDYFYSV